jgi:hypothetical protein
MARLINKLKGDEIEDLKSQSMDYPALIQQFGPPENIIDKCMGQIEPEILELQGLVVSSGRYAADLAQIYPIL